MLPSSELIETLPLEDSILPVKSTLPPVALTILRFPPAETRFPTATSAAESPVLVIFMPVCAATLFSIMPPDTVLEANTLPAVLVTEPEI